MILKLSKFLIALGVVFIPVDMNIPFKPFLIFLFIGSILFIWSFVNSKEIILYRRNGKKMLILHICLCFLLLSTLISASNGYLTHNIVPEYETIRYISRLFFSIFVFFVVKIMMETDQKLIKWIVFLVAFPFFDIIFIFIYYPDVYNEAGRFVGFTDEDQPNTAALNLVPSFCLSLSSCMQESHIIKSNRSLIYLLMSLIDFFLVLITQSRSALVTIIVMTIVIFYYYFPFRKVILSICFISFALMIEYCFSFPSLVLQEKLPRLFQFINGLWHFDDTISFYMEAGHESRFLASSYYYPIIKENFLLGLGPDFQQKFSYYNPFVGEFDGVNSILDLAIYTGALGVICYSVIYLVLMTELIKKRGLPSMNAPIIMALLGILILSIFIGNQLICPYFWILLSLVCFEKVTKKKYVTF